MKVSFLRLLGVYLFILSLIINCFQMTVFGSNQVTNNYESISVFDALNTINAFKRDRTVQYTIKSQRQLIGFSGQYYTYYQLNPNGFAVIMNSNGSMVEASYNNDIS